MFRPAQPGDWADEDEDVEVKAPQTYAQAAAPAGVVVASPRRQPTNATGNFNASPQRETQAPVANRWERFRQQQAEQQQSDHQYERSSSGGARGYGGRDRDRDRDYYGGGGRDRDYGNSRDYYGGGGGRDRDYGSRDRDYGGGRDRDHGYGGRDRGHRDDFRGPPMTTERGVVVSVKENFGFVSCVERDGDLFFHISEAPVDVELQDEVEFKVKYNQRSQKDIAVQLVRLPKGSIVWEDVTEELFDGVVAKGIPRSSSYHSHGSGGHSRDDAHGMIEVRRQQEQGDEATDENKEAGDAESTEAPSSTSKRREFVRYSADSVGPIAGSEAEADQKSGKKSPVPHFGDEVRFRIATHRKSGLKRAVDLTVTLSAKAKLEKEMDEKLKTMTREQGVITRIKSGGGFIRCCERTDDVYFPFHEIRESEDDDKSKGKGKLQLREGDEVSFYVYEDKDGNDERPTHHSGSQRLSALRVVKLPTGTVSFEDVLRTNIEGVVTKVPKEPRSGPEIFGVINPSNPEDAVVPKDESEEKQSDERNNGKKLKKKAAGVSFRLSDASDVTYIPATGDVVMFDQVMDKRSRRVKASNVRIVQFNQKHRETGVITTVREEFGFIKCAERHADAYFRFGDVMSVNNDFRTGTEVAFDVSGDGKDSGKGHGKDKESVRAHRVEILPPGSVKWETELATDLEGELLVVPSRHHKQHQKPGGKPQHHKPQYGRVRVSLGKEKHLIDFFPEYKEQIAATFFADSESKDGEEELKLEFPSTLSKYERAAIHAYCDWLGIKHESSGDGANRRLTVSANARIEKTTIDSLVAAQADAPVTADLEFHAEDVVDVRYNPHVGDQVKLNLVLVKRSKQLLAKSVVLVTPAPSKPKATTAAKQDTDSQLPAGEGFIVVLKQDGGFGFIEPADQGVTGSENLFFHVKEIISGQTVTDLKEGMEVKYHVIHDEKKKKTRATGIVVVPAGTVKKVEAALVRGVVHRPSLLHRFRKTNARFGKNDKNKQMSTPGRIRITNDEAASAVEEEEEDDEDDDEEGDAEEHTGEVEGEQKTTELELTKKPKEEKSKQKKPSSSSYIYFINDISDPTVILREGDEVEFVPHTSPKGLRAMKIKVVKSHAKQGVVVKVNSENGGVIKVDESDEEIGFAARGVLRGDTLGEGDRVEFAVVKRPVEKKNPAKKKEEEKKTDAEKSEGDAVEGETTGEAVAEDTSSGPETTSPFVATSILCLASAGNSKSSRDRDASRPESRTVNSTLLQAMRQVGASAVVKSRMAKGPDGTRGFPEGWRSSVKREPAVTPAPAE